MRGGCNRQYSELWRILHFYARPRTSPHGRCVGRARCAGCVGAKRTEGKLGGGRGSLEPRSGMRRADDTAACGIKSISYHVHRYCDSRGGGRLRRAGRKTMALSAAAYQTLLQHLLRLRAACAFLRYILAACADGTLTRLQTATDRFGVRLRSPCEHGGSCFPARQKNAWPRETQASNAHIASHCLYSRFSCCGRR